MSSGRRSRGWLGLLGCLLKLCCSIIIKLTRKVCSMLERFCMFPVVSSKSSRFERNWQLSKRVVWSIKNCEQLACFASNFGDVGVNVTQKSFDIDSFSQRSKENIFSCSRRLWHKPIPHCCWFIKQRVAGNEKKTVSAVIENVWYDSWRREHKAGIRVEATTFHSNIGFIV